MIHQVPEKIYALIKYHIHAVMISIISKAPSLIYEKSITMKLEATLMKYTTDLITNTERHYRK